MFVEVERWEGGARGGGGGFALVPGVGGGRQVGGVGRREGEVGVGVGGAGGEEGAEFLGGGGEV